MTPPPLHSYQREAVSFLHGHDRGVLMLEMGLGKTATVLSALTPERLPVLVTAPPRVAEVVWAAEVAKWRPDLSVVPAVGPPAKRARAFASRPDIVVISNSVQALDFALPYAGRFSTLVVDELSAFKDRSTRRWKTAKKLAAAIPRLWGMTGTPAPNGLLNLWSQMFLLDGGRALGRTLGEYRARYFREAGRLPSGVVTGWELRPGAAGAIHRRIEPLAISMDTDGKLALPPVTYNDVVVPLPADVRRVYDRLRRDLVADLTLLGEDVVHSAANAAVLTGKLSQVTAGFSYPDTDDLDARGTVSLHTEKIKALTEIVEGSGSPVLVFYHFREELAMLRDAFPSAVAIQDRPVGQVVADWDAGKIPVLLAHPASAGHGLNLQHGGHVVVWTTLTWSLELYQQANARLARQGQTRPVVVHHLVAPRTVDGVMLERLAGKDVTQRALLKHLELL